MQADETYVPWRHKTYNRKTAHKRMAGHPRLLRSSPKKSSNYRNSAWKSRRKHYFPSAKKRKSLPPFRSNHRRCWVIPRTCLAKPKSSTVPQPHHRSHTSYRGIPRSNCNSQKLAKNLLKHLNIKIKSDLATLLKERFNLKLEATQLLIMPSFNNFLGGQPINRKIGKNNKSKKFIGPILRYGNVDLKNAEAYLLDGTFLGKLEYLKRLS
jgi:hypothetical protein